MRVVRLRVAEHPLLRDLAAYLDGACAPAPPFDERGDWRADVSSGPPTEDRAKPHNYRRQYMQTPLRLPSMDSDTIVSALNYYPPGGAGIGWHTDSTAPGWRVYIARPLGGTPGAFVTVEEVIFDAPGIALAFCAGPASWHAVVSPAARFSVGLRIKGERSARLLGLV